MELTTGSHNLSLFKVGYLIIGQVEMMPLLLSHSSTVFVAIHSLSLLDQLPKTIICFHGLLGLLDLSTACYIIGSSKNNTLLIGLFIWKITGWSGIVSQFFSVLYLCASQSMRHCYCYVPSSCLQHMQPDE